MLRRLPYIIFSLFFLAGALTYIYRGPLALRAMKQLAPSIMLNNVIEELPDGLHLLLVGAGSPLADPIRSGPCVAIAAGKKLFIVDAGSAAARGLSMHRWQPAMIEGLFLTHFHSDHIDGIGELALQRWAGSGSGTPLPIYGPTGVETIVNGFNQAYQLDSRYRTAHHGEDTMPLQGAGSTAIVFDEPEAREYVTLYEQDGILIRAFKVHHAPVEPAVGYRFDYAGRSLVISGDTVQSENLEWAAENVDLLVHEALARRIVGVLRDAARSANNQRLGRIMADILDYHTDPIEAAQSAQRAGVGHLLFYHIAPALRVPGLEAAFLEGVSDHYTGKFTLGRDGTFISLPAGSDRIITH